MFQMPSSVVLQSCNIFLLSFLSFSKSVQECQLADWAIHKAECECLQRVATLSSDSQNPSIPPDAVRCLGRILFLKRKNGHIVGQPAYEAVEQLSHRA